jgi:hypothetical protein
VFIDLHRRESGDRSAQDVGRHPWSGPDFENVVTQISPTERPGQDLALDGFGPFSARTKLEMALVHDVDSVLFFPQRGPLQGTDG